MKINTKIRKKFRIRNKLKKISSIDRYRLSIFRSSKNISAQIIDDKNSITLASVTSNQKSIKNIDKTKSELSSLIADKLADKAKELKINKIYFDRGIYKYHGRIKIFAEALRKKGLEF